MKQETQTNGIGFLRNLAICLFISVCLLFSVSAHATGIAGLCGALNGGEFGTAPTDKSQLCTRGLTSTVSGTSSSWSWTCQGSGTSGNASCSATNCGVAPPVTTVNGACKAYSGTHSSQPASNTSNGCTAGTYVNMANSGGKFRWRCNGIDGGSYANCTANEQLKWMLVGISHWVDGGSYIGSAPKCTNTSLAGDGHMPGDEPASCSSLAAPCWIERCFSLSSWDGVTKKCTSSGTFWMYNNFQCQ